MLDPVWDPSGKARDALRAIVSDFGTRALSSPSILDNVLHDLLPDSPKQVSLILATGGSQVAALLEEHVTQGMDPDTAVRLAATQLAEQTPYDAAGCRWVTGEFARALGYQVTDESAMPEAASGTPITPAAPMASLGTPPDQAVTVLPEDAAVGQPDPVSAQGVTAPTTRGRRRLLVGLAALVVIVGGLVGGAAATKTWPFHSGPIALKKLLPGDTSACTTKVTPFKNHLQGMTSVLACRVGAINGVLFAYQFDSAGDYQAALDSFNRVSGFSAGSAGSNCPTTGGREGETSWYTTETGLYPKTSGQVLECYTVEFNSSGNNPLQPIYVWTVPTQNTFLQAIAGASTTMRQLDTWWTHNGGPDAK